MFTPPGWRFSFCERAVIVWAMATNTKTKTRKSKRGQRDLTPEHKAALAEGRSQGRVVRRYLEALETHKPKRGRKMTQERITQRLEEISDEMESASPAVRVQLAQERINLLAKQSAGEDTGELEEAEAEFIEHAKAYSERKGISYSAWRDAGVPAAVLKQAGFTATRTRKSS